MSCNDLPCQEISLNTNSGTRGYFWKFLDVDTHTQGKFESSDNGHQSNHPIIKKIKSVFNGDYSEEWLPLEIAHMLYPLLLSFL